MLDHRRESQLVLFGDGKSPPRGVGLIKIIGALHERQTIRPGQLTHSPRALLTNADDGEDRERERETGFRMSWRQFLFADVLPECPANKGMLLHSEEFIGEVILWHGTIDLSINDYILQ